MFNEVIDAQNEKRQKALQDLSENHRSFFAASRSAPHPYILRL